MNVSKSEYWWSTLQVRPVWIEITRRPNDDIGSDLNHRQSSLSAYELLGEPRPNDRVLHWDSKRSEFVGVSTVKEQAVKRGGSRFVVLERFIELPSRSLTLEMVRENGSALKKFRDDIAKIGGSVFFPFQPYGEKGWGEVRPAQSYLTAAPSELVELLGGIYESHRERTPLTASWRELGFGPTVRIQKQIRRKKSKTAFERYLQANEGITLTASGKVKAPDLSRLQASYRAHNALQNKFATWLVERGLNPHSPHAMDDHAADVQWTVGSTKYVAEVKSINGDNSVSQIRKGIGQVLHYRELAAVKHKGIVIAVLVVSSDPGKIWKDVCDDAGIRLVWPGKFTLISKR